MQVLREFWKVWVFRRWRHPVAGSPERSADVMGNISRDDALRHAQAIVDAVELPVSADLENGFGHEPFTVAETVRMAAEVGLVGCSIEDATGESGFPIHDIKSATARVRAAVAAARSTGFDFVLTARCECFLRGQPDLKAVILRLRAYEAAGADV